MCRRSLHDTVFLTLGAYGKSQGKNVIGFKNGIHAEIWSQIITSGLHCFDGSLPLRSHTPLQDMYNAANIIRKYAQNARHLKKIEHLHRLLFFH